jgi:hypothetical protein
MVRSRKGNSTTMTDALIPPVNDITEQWQHNQMDTVRRRKEQQRWIFWGRHRDHYQFITAEPVAGYHTYIEIPVPQFWGRTRTWPFPSPVLIPVKAMSNITVAYDGE